MSIAYAAVWFFVFSLPWENFIVIPGVGVFSRVIGAVAVGLTIVVNVISGRFRRWHVFHVAALLFVVWAAGVLLIFYNPAVMPKKFWTFVQLLVMIWMIWELAPSRSRVIGLLNAYVLGSYVSALDTILLYRRAGGAARRFAGGGGDPNDLAMTLAAAIPMAWYLGMTYHRPIVRWACRAYIPLGLLAIGLTGSRGGMIASLVGLLDRAADHDPTLARQTGAGDRPACHLWRNRGGLCPEDHRQPALDYHQRGGRPEPRRPFSDLEGRAFMLLPNAR